MLADPMFQNKSVVAEKLADFGFKLENGVYTYSAPIINGQFNLLVLIDEHNGEVKTHIYDTNTNDEYILHLTNDAVGAFVGRVRTEYTSVLQKIADNCFTTKVFKSPLADKIIEYVRQTYHNELEFLWEKFSQNAVVRRSDNQKWYIVLLTISKNKLGLAGSGEAEIIDLRADPEEIADIVDNKKYFPGYHMNKKHWLTICLDGSVGFEEICRRIKISHDLALK